MLPLKEATRQNSGNEQRPKSEFSFLLDSFIPEAHSAPGQGMEATPYPQELPAQGQQNQ